MGGPAPHFLQTFVGLEAQGHFLTNNKTITIALFLCCNPNTFTFGWSKNVVVWRWRLYFQRWVSRRPDCEHVLRANHGSHGQGDGPSTLLSEPDSAVLKSHSGKRELSTHASGNGFVAPLVRLVPEHSDDASSSDLQRPQSLTSQIFAPMKSPTSWVGGLVSAL